MANDLRVRQNFIGGTTTDAPLAIGATTLNSAALANVPVIGVLQHYPIILDPQSAAGAPEIIYVTAHTAGATSATVQRAREGTTARSHVAGTAWLHGPTVKDFGVIRDARWAIPANYESIDEFNDEILDPAWVQVSPTGGAARSVWTEGRDVLSVKQEGGDAASVAHGFMRPIGAAMVVGDAFEICYTPHIQWATNYIMAGIALSDGITAGVGEQVFGMNYTSTGGNMTVDTRTATGWTIGAASVAVLGPYWGPNFYRFVLVAANTWRYDTSPDGVSWLIGGTLARTLTPTHVGLWQSSWGAAVKAVGTYEFLRRRSGVT